MPYLQNQFERNFMTTSVDYVFNWARKSAVWPLTFVAGTVTLKMSPVLKRIWDQMPEPKWCISMGACSSVGGPFNTYGVLQGVDKIVPVDVYVTGCPPRPENLFYALLKLQDKIDTMTTLERRPTQVRLDETMLEDFQKRVMVAQTQNPV